MDTEMMTSSKVNARERRMGKVTLNAENHNTPGDRRWMLNCLLAKVLPAPQQSEISFDVYDVEEGVP